MTLRHRISTAIAAAGLLLLTGPAMAQAEYPDHPVHVVLGFSAGSGADILGRYFAHQIEVLSKQPVIVDNKPGATGNIALRFVAQAKPDGYNILFTANSNMAGSRYLFKDLPFDTLKDFVPVASFAQIAFVVVVSPNSPYKTIAELTAHLKEKKDNIFGYTNQTALLSGEYYKQLAGVSAKAVSYKTAADAMRDVIDSTLDFMVMDGTFAAGQIRQGQLKALAVTTAQRSPTLKDTPTMQEAGITGYEFAPWWGCYVPKGTPQPIIDKLSGWFKQIAAMPETPIFLETIASISQDQSGPEAAARLQAELPKWETLVKAAGIEPQ
ncbi:MAG: Tripartite-type tricarboxylate transporter, receptor component TctC [Rhodospirillales bacterium]|jgi:tripartite-type tricarboxylate transporter receptor subunit TctC|nr:Tripartite-type tricarboxylate transporter, receptor component TctC [Rhodospirillales bacterium]